MKRLLTLLTILFLAGLGPVLAQPAPLPDNPMFDQTVQFVTDAGGASLRGMLQALAESVGLVPVFGDFPDRAITQEISTPTPFRQVWALVLTLYDLDYVLQDNDVVVVGTAASIARLIPPEPEPEPEPVVAVVEPPVGTDREPDPLLSQTYRINNSPEEVTSLINRLVPGAEVEALPLGNSIVVRGTAVEQAQVQAALDQFDVVVAAEVIEPVEQRTYGLSNAKAVELAAVLQRTGVVTNLEGSSTTIIENFIVTAEPRTNSIIVTATGPVQAQIADLITELDVPQRQVNIQLRIQEIQRRTAQNFGLDIEGNFGNMTINILDTGLSLTQIFDSNPFFSFQNIMAMLDTLETQGLSRRVDDSNITVLNNEPGRMQSGGRIEIQFPSSSGEIQTRTIEFGVIIEVTPRVASDGRVILEIQVEVSDVLVPLSEGGIPQRIDFSDRQVSSTVTLEQGQTVLLGGLLQNQFSQSESRIPILGSIPLIGDLFGRTIIEDEASELLLVVNALVID